MTLISNPVTAFSGNESGTALDQYQITNVNQLHEMGEKQIYMY